MLRLTNLIKFILITILVILSYINVRLGLEVVNIVNIVFILIIINSLLYKKEFSKITKFLNIYLLFIILLIILSVNQAKYLGYENGILKGNVYGVSYYDSAVYYENIINMNYGFNFSNLTFDYTSEYKFNIFTIISYIFSLIFGSSIINIISINYIYSLLFIHLYIRFLDIFLEKVKLRYVIVVIFYPGFILMNISLMRDTLINLLIVAIVYYFYKNKYKHSNILKMMLAFFILLTLRAYTAFILIILLFLIYNFKLNFNNIIKNIGYLFIVIFIVNKFSILAGYGPMGQQYIQTYMNNSLIDSLIDAILRLLFGFGIVKEALFSRIIFNILVMSSPIYISLISIFLFYKILTQKIYLSQNIIKVIKFIILFAYMNALILILRDGIVVERIYNMWIWLVVLILSFQKNNIKQNFI